VPERVLRPLAAISHISAEIAKQNDAVGIPRAEMRFLCAGMLHLPD